MCSQRGPRGQPAGKLPFGRLSGHDAQRWQLGAIHAGGALILARAVDMLQTQESCSLVHDHFVFAMRCFVYMCILNAI